MATRTAILNVGIVLNQCLEEIAKEEAPVSRIVRSYVGKTLLVLIRSAA
jgi:hypothetical protein